MKEYSIILSNSSKKFIKKLNKPSQIRIFGILDDLKLYPNDGKPLVGPLKGKRSYRTGKYRIIYDIIDDRLIIFVIDIDLRKKVYDWQKNSNSRFKTK